MNAFINMEASDYTIYHGDFVISTNQALLDIPMIHQFLSTEAYWSIGIPYETVKTASEQSLCFGLYHQSKQIGYARIITDYASMAYLCDVFIIQSYRGQGLSKWLLQCIHGHPRLKKLRRWILVTKDAHGLYNQFGWQLIDHPELWMQIHDNNIYKQISDRAMP